MVSISTSFQVIDTVLDPRPTTMIGEGLEAQPERDSSFRQFYNRFLYNFTSILLVLFDN